MSGSCPKCSIALQDDFGCESCARCGGTFFSVAQAMTYFMLSTDDADAAGDELRASFAPSKLRCPSCAGSLHPVDVGDFALDICRDCRGFFFDAGEVLKLKGMLAQGIVGLRVRRVLRRLQDPGLSLGGPYR